MRTRQLITTAIVAVATLAASGVKPAAAAAPSEPAMEQCILPPGVYAIFNSNSELVGILIVYPDCRTEVIAKKTEDGVLL